MTSHNKKYCKCSDCSVERYEKAVAESFKIAEEEREWKNAQWERL